MKKIFILCLVAFNMNIQSQVKIICNEIKTTKTPLPEVLYVNAIQNTIKGGFEASDKNLKNQSIVETEIHPFVSALYYAYADHRPVSISPDMIWLLICQGFSTHVSLNSETLRDRLVSFDNKKKITINTEFISNDFIKGSEKSPWNKTFPVFSDSISKYVKSDIHNLFVQTFSTTTDSEKAAFEVALLNVMGNYFDYEVSTACGIPEIIIEGSKEDWQKIYSNLNNFKGYNIDNWIDVLKPIIQQFVNASENKIEKDFWSNIFKRKDESGGPYITGWMVKFFPYVSTDTNKMIKNPYLNREPEQFMEGLQTNQFNKGLSKVDFVWNYFNKEYKMEFIAGFIGIKQDKKSLTLRPIISWIVIDKENNSLESIKKKEINNNFNSYKNWKTYSIILLISILIILLIVLKCKKR